MLLGYNTNGLPHHRLIDAIDLLAELGYRSVSLTIDAGALDPFEEPGQLCRQVSAVRARLDRHEMGRVVETGARYLLNPRRKHDPTLLDPDPARRAIRIDFLNRAIDLARELDAGVVSLWSGALTDGIDPAEGLDRLVESLRPVLAHAETTGCVLGFEPEPGFFIDRLERFAALDARLGHPLLQLTLDIGHVHCNEPGAIADHVLQWGRRIVNVHIEDMVRDVHDHRMFGEGTIPFPPVLDALGEVGYAGGVHVELSRHGHAAVEAATRSAAFLRPLARWD
jgi:sugar phosphate isomerase/epimerase